MVDSSSEESGSLQEVDDDMTLGQFQTNAKIEAIARRAPSKRGAKLKKWRSSPLI